jgi:hypothetical protein
MPIRAPYTDVHDSPTCRHGTCLTDHYFTDDQMRLLNLGQGGAPFIGMHVRAGDACGTWRGLGGEWYSRACSPPLNGTRVLVPAL